MVALIRGDRYDAVRICLGEGLLQKMADCKLFMVNPKLYKYVGMHNSESLFHKLSTAV